VYEQAYLDAVLDEEQAADFGLREEVLARVFPEREPGAASSWWLTTASRTTPSGWTGWSW